MWGTDLLIFPFKPNQYRAAAKNGNPDKLVEEEKKNNSLIYIRSNKHA